MRLGALFGPDIPVKAAWADCEIAGLAADSRAVRPGFVFAALRGVKADGARFVADAVAAGAAAVLADEDAAIDVPDGVAVVRAGNPRRALARAAARFYGRQPEVVVAVTGTNGKTSVVSFVRQIWEAMGLMAASAGTVGVVGPRGERPLAHTTPDPVALQALLAELDDEGVTHAAIEASSHGLAQCRLDGVRLTAGAFTNLSRDHLDYHASAKDYFEAKARLFRELLPEGAAACINMDSEDGKCMAEIARERGLALTTVGRHGTTLRLTGWSREGLGQRLVIAAEGSEHEVFLPLVGDFQASNALVAAGLVIAAGGPAGIAVRSLDRLKGASGRLELVAMTGAQAPVFVDYAHTPDALDNALRALRPYASGRLVVVFGAGGDRDHGKRPLMGEAAARHADLAIVTDDNPRTEDPAAIRREVMARCPDAVEIGDRAEAIERAMSGLGQGDVLLVAGKGHERGQTVGTRTIPFSDHEVVRGLAGREDEREAIHG